jgi:hypothetical protein
MVMGGEGIKGGWAWKAGRSLHAFGSVKTRKAFDRESEVLMEALKVWVSVGRFWEWLSVGGWRLLSIVEMRGSHLVRS